MEYHTIDLQLISLAISNPTCVGALLRPFATERGPPSSKENTKEMPVTNIPNLYLKWSVFRSLILIAGPDARIAREIFGDTSDAPIQFAKMLRGDYGLQPDIASALARVINARIDLHRSERKLSGLGPRVSADDLYGGVYDFAKRLIKAAEIVEPDRLSAADRKLLDELAPKGPATGMPRLVVKRSEPERWIRGMVPSGGSGPVEFEAGRHEGQLTIEGLTADPVVAYALAVRDPAPNHLWDFAWGDTVRWVPSPIRLVSVDNGFNLMPKPAPILPVPGRFLVMAVVVLEREVLKKLDPRGFEAMPGCLDEQQTARFLTVVRRLVERNGRPTPSIMLVTNEYRVR